METCIPFREVLVKVEGTAIPTDLYSKPTDILISNHVLPTIQKIIFCLASRIITITKVKRLQEKRLTELNSKPRIQN